MSVSLLRLFLLSKTVLKYEEKSSSWVGTPSAREAPAPRNIADFIITPQLIVIPIMSSFYVISKIYNPKYRNKFWNMEG